MKSEKTKINWPAVKQRLEESQQALEAALTPPPDKLQAVFRQRAERLAAKQTAPQADAPILPVLVFRLSNEQYGIATTELAEIVPVKNCTPVPFAPPEFAGVLNFRGALRTIADLKIILGLSVNGSPGGGNALFFRNSKLGLIVDTAEKILPIRIDKLTLPENQEPGTSTRFLRGVTPENIIILNSQAIIRHLLLDLIPADDQVTVP